jgi:alpha-L-fucosidase
LHRRNRTTARAAGAVFFGLAPRADPHRTEPAPRSRAVPTLVPFVPALVSCLISAADARPPAEDSPEVKVYTETTAQRDARMAWWRDARFGMFIHWGLYAIPAGEWDGKKTSGTGEWILRNSKADLEQYKALKDRFNPVKFDADAWASLAKRAGMKYVVITSKHHDGFALFDSKVSDYDVMATPFKRDIMKELSQACAKQKLTMCWYHSILDWQHHDFLPRLDWDKRPTENADLDRYVTYMKAQLKELLTNYGPIGVLWFDGEWENTWTHARGADLDLYVRSLQPNIIINNRVDKGRNDMAGLNHAGEWAGDYGTPEQEVPATGLPGVDWESCMTMNDTWGWRADDKDWKSTRELVHTLCDIASKGGNFLLNVGPTAEGLIPPESIERLEAMGRWMAVNGDAIYATHAGPFPSLAWGRCTQRTLDAGRTRLFLHVFEAPTDGMLVIPGLATDPSGVRSLADPKATLSFSRQGDAVVIDLPPSAAPAGSETLPTVVVVDLPSAPEVFTAPALTQDRGFLDSLDVSVPASSGLEARYTLDGTEPSASSPLADKPIVVDRTTKLAARYFRAGKAVSPPVSRTFTKVEPREGAERPGAPAGLNARCFEGEFGTMPDFATLHASRELTAENVSDTLRTRDENFAIEFTGYFHAPARGMYTFTVKADDGAKLWIGSDVIVDNDGLHAARERTGEVALGPGWHPVRIGYFNRSGDRALEVFVQGPGGSKARVADEAWSR